MEDVKLWPNLNNEKVEVMEIKFSPKKRSKFKKRMINFIYNVVLASILIVIVIMFANIIRHI